MRRIAAVFLFAGLAGCTAELKDDLRERDADSATIQGRDTLSSPTVVPTTDSVVTTTTVTSDTAQGQASSGETDQLPTRPRPGGPGKSDELPTRPRPGNP
jgi:hypothetical protein